MPSVPALEISQVGPDQWDQCLCGLPIAPDGLVSPRCAGGTATGLGGGCECATTRPEGELLLPISTFSLFFKVICKSTIIYNWFWIAAQTSFR